MSGVCVMVTRRKEAELARLAAAEETSRLKDEFLATLSHELRTPLNAILGWVQMLQSGRLSAARTLEAIDVISRNARLQGQLIEDILDVSRIISGKLEIERDGVAVPQLIETVIAGVAPAAEAKGIVLRQRVSNDLPPIEGDARRLHQVLNNVLVNAVKFTPDGGSIVLDCEADGQWLHLQVQDSGAGIDPAFLPYVFDRFRQGDSRATRSHGGLGLGLAIAQHLVQRHGGEIRAESEGLRRGATIVIRLPTATTTARALADRPAVANEIRLDGLGLLVVDDQRDSREMIAALLEQQGAIVTQRDSAERALTFLAERSVHLLIADIAMPNVDGYEFLQRLRAAGNRTPAIAVTAFARPEDRRHAIQAGYSGYLAKPIDAGQLARTVREVVAAPTAACPVGGI
jgi:CheY-like chemotaxis protein/nitrogen-specific signal transduction histidine kinase